MKKILIIFTLLPFLAFSQSFYSEKVVQKIEIQFDFNDWSTRLDTAKNGAEGYIVAKSVKINGQKFDSVGVKYKGNSSYKATNKKNPLHLSLDFVKNQDYQGITDIKLANVFADPTFIKEQLSYDILRNYMDAPDCNQAAVYINGQFYGVMTNSEPINKAFLLSRLDENNGVFIKCNPPESLGSTGLPSLVYLGNDSSLYQKHYELKSKTGWNQLVNLVNTLSNKPIAELENQIDIDRSLWMLAFNNTFVNLDSYSGSFAQNYYLYQDKTKRFLPIIWDLNMCFGGFTRTGESPALSMAALPELNIFLHEKSADRPLIKQLLANPTYRKMYIAKMNTLVKENISNNYYYTKAIELQKVIDTLVVKDNNKFFTNQQYKDNLSIQSNGAGAAGTNGFVPGLKSLLGVRLTYLKTMPEFNFAAPKIDTTFAPKDIFLKDKINITAKITNTKSVFLKYRYAKNDKFVSVEMFDDGKHNDGALNDNVFGASFTMQNSRAEYYVFAENDQAVTFLPARAEHEFFTLKVNQSVVKIQPKQLVINEIMASNTKTAKDEKGEFNDYIELKNNTANDIDLSNVFLSDDDKKPLKWQFKVNSTIKAGKYLTVWADATITQGDFHTNFKVSSSGEKIILSNLDNSVIDSVSTPLLKDDQVFARCPDGTGKFKLSNPTFGADNACKTANHDLFLENNFYVYPNPATQFLTITQSENTNLPLVVYEISSGRQVYKTYSNEEKIDVSNWNTGLYIIKKGNISKKIVIMK